MIQEYVACRLNINLGNYYHFVGSLHLYEDKAQKAKSYINEGYHTTLKPMHNMPAKDVEKNLDKLIMFEEKIRMNIENKLSDTPDYWVDLIFLLKVFNASKRRSTIEIENFKSRFSDKNYLHFVNQKLDIIGIN